MREKCGPAGLSFETEFEIEGVVVPEDVFDGIAELLVETYIGRERDY